MIEIEESKMLFGPFPENSVYHIEKSDAYKKLGSQGVKTVEFIYRHKKNSLLFVEAKESSPAPGNQGNFGEFISEIVLKFRCSFELWLALKLKRKKDVIDYNMLDGVDVADEKQKFVFVLVINGHKVDWLPPIRAALERSMKADIKIWQSEIIVLNDTQAQERGFVKAKRN